MVCNTPCLPESCDTLMNVRNAIARLALNEDLNFLVTNRIPRLQVTRFMGWFSKIENPLIRDLSIAVWKLFADLDLSDARKTDFKSLHDCFVRQLRDGARVIDRDPQVLVSPSDAIVGACGTVEHDQVFQAKGFPYSTKDLFGSDSVSAQFDGGVYVTLRLTSSMYHRFHSSHDMRIDKVRYFSGDTWNVNPIALKRVERLFCKNERALISARLTASGHRIALVPVAAILVASIRLPFLDLLLNQRYRGPMTVDCATPFLKGEEIGWFEHGSTIIVFAPKGFALCEHVHAGKSIQMGMPLLRLPSHA
jgi:phosphatidylserine decarboxylase